MDSERWRLSAATGASLCPHGNTFRSWPQLAEETARGERERAVLGGDICCLEPGGAHTAGVVAEAVTAHVVLRRVCGEA